MSLRLADRWDSKISTFELRYETRWHLLGMVEFCTNVDSDGTISQRNAQCCSDVPDPASCVEELIRKGLVRRINAALVEVIDYHQYGPQRIVKDWISPTLRDAVYERDGRRCLACGVADDLTCDHVYPEHLGGATAFENLQTLCRVCNSSKGLAATDYRGTGRAGTERPTPGAESKIPQQPGPPLPPCDLSTGEIKPCILCEDTTGNCTCFDDPSPVLGGATTYDRSMEPDGWR